MFDAGSPLPGLLLAAMIILTLLLLPYIDSERPRIRDDEHQPPTEELRLRAQLVARTRNQRGEREP